MTENKQVQIIIRTTQEEKAIITQKAKDKGISVNEFIKRIILETISKKISTIISVITKMISLMISLKY